MVDCYFVILSQVELALVLQASKLWHLNPAMRDATPMKHPVFYLHCHLMAVTQNMDLSSKKPTNASVAVLCARCPQRLMLFTVRQTRYQTAQRDGQQLGLATVSSRYLCSENNSADQLCGYRAADLHLCFGIFKSRFSHEEAQTAHKNGQQHGLATVSSRFVNMNSYRGV